MMSLSTGVGDMTLVLCKSRGIHQEIAFELAPTTISPRIFILYNNNMALATLVFQGSFNFSSKLQNLNFKKL